jgi:threonine synthase
VSIIHNLANEGKLMAIRCTHCQFEPDHKTSPYRCQVCGGYFDYDRGLEYEPAAVDRNQPGIWRYRSVFDLPDGVAPVSLGEGSTPLIWDEVEGKQVALKLDYLNPTGSYKDRGMTVLVSYMAWLGVKKAIEDSSGNAGASFAAYCSRAGVEGRVYVPDYSSGPKRAQIEAYGCELVPVPGPRSKAAEAVEREAELGTFYASHVYQPYVIPGYATAAIEMVEQLGGAPGSVLLPVGQGSNLLGIARGFDALVNTGLIAQGPQIIGVQSRACAPLWAAAKSGIVSPDAVAEGETYAEGIRILNPLRRKEVLDAVASSRGWMEAVEEADILPGRDELAARGFHVEPTSAVVWPALIENFENLKDPIVLVLTGSGLKYAPN